MDGSADGRSVADLPQSSDGLCRRKIDRDRHFQERIRRPDEAASHRYGLTYVARDGDRDQVEAAHAAVRRVEGDPARTRHINLGPGMGRSPARDGREALALASQIARHDPRAEAEATRRLD